MSICEKNASRSKAVDVGRESLRVAAEASDPVVKIIDGDEEDVGLFRGLKKGGEQECEPKGEVLHEGDVYHENADGPSSLKFTFGVTGICDLPWRWCPRD